MATKIIDLKGLSTLDPKLYTYIGRKMGDREASPLMNPYKRGTDGIPDNETAVIKYLQYVGTIPNIAQEIENIRGKVLACWCKGPKGTGICHGDVLVHLADNTMSQEYKSLLLSKGYEVGGDVPVVPSWYGEIVKGTYEEKYKENSVTQIVSPNKVYLESSGENPLSLNKVYGMFYGAILGDALGVPHEFPSNMKFPYTGKLEHQYIHKNRFDNMNGRAGVVLAIGQYSDDSEMALALSNSLIRNRGFNNDDVIESYIRWANSGQVMMGTNSRELFKGGTKGKPIMRKTYDKRYVSKFGEGVVPGAVSTKSQENQSNGSLMRCFPLACLGKDKNIDANAVMMDVWITNPSTVNYWCEYIYLTAIRLALLNTSRGKIWETVFDFTKDPEIPECVARMINNVVNGVIPPINYDGKKKVRGWVCTSFYTAISSLYSIVKDPNLTYPDVIKWVIELGGDTDTNACISGALIGALLGYRSLYKDETTKDNLQIMITSTSRGSVYERPPEYQLSDSMAIAKSLHALGSL